MAMTMPPLCHSDVACDIVNGAALLRAAYGRTSPSLVGYPSALLAPIYLRALVTHEPLDTAHLARAVDLTVRMLRPAP
jgi:hypothetical protein